MELGKWRKRRRSGTDPIFVTLPHKSYILRILSLSSSVGTCTLTATPKQRPLVLYTVL